MTSSTLVLKSHLNHFVGQLVLIHIIDIIHLPMHIQNVDVRCAKPLQAGFERQMHGLQVISSENCFLFDGWVASVDVAGVLMLKSVSQDYA